MTAIAEVLGRVLADVGTSLAHNWPYLLTGIVVAAVIQVYVGTDRLARWMRGRTRWAVLGAVAFGALTPLCSCGTTAVVLGAMASSVPWAPVVAFMVSSPLTSPSEYVWSVGLFGADFATTYFVAAIVIGLAAGALTSVVERSGLLRGQERVRPAVTGCSDGCGGPAARVDQSVAFEGPASVPSPAGRTMLAELRTAPATCCTAVMDAPVVGSASAPAAGLAVVATSRLGDLARALVLNARRLAVYFLGFATLGYLVIELVPTQLLTSYLGGGSFLSVPLAATLGVPVYLSSDGSLPLVASLLHGGMGPGAALAFLVTGAGTSVGAISGMLVIARWRVVALVVGCLWVGAVLLGYLAPLWL